MFILSEMLFILSDGQESLSFVLSLISSTQSQFLIVCECVCVLWCVYDFITSESKMALRQSLGPGRVQLSRKYEQRRCIKVHSFL